VNKGKTDMKSLTRSYLAAAVFILALPISANALDATPQCRDAAGKASTKYYDTLLTYSFRCYSSAALGYGDGSCQTDQVDLGIDTRLGNTVLKANDKLDSRLTKGCGTDKMGNGFKYPCSTNEGVLLVSDYYQCVVYTAHGASAAYIQGLIYPNGAFASGADGLICQQGIATASAALAKSVMTARRGYGSDILFKRPASLQKMNDTIAAAKTTASNAINNVCKTNAIIAKLPANGCSVNTANRDYTRDCVIGKVAGEAGALSDIVYDK
jgi:hypothetical protein